MKFTIRDLFLVTVIVALVLALIFTKWQTGPGRYTMLTLDIGWYLFDTQTGQVWKLEDGAWKEDTRPVGQPNSSALAPNPPKP